MSYPSPCDTCESPCGGGSGCKKWKIRYRYRQKQINDFAKQILRPAIQIRKPKGFTYDHPDDVRRYLCTNPCKGCLLEADCDIPCLAYLHWWDMRMELARKKAQL